MIKLVFYGTIQRRNILDFTDKFKTDLDCLEYLTNIKWSSSFICKKCGNLKHTIQSSNYARDCNSCHHIESPTTGTLFHKVKFGLGKAFTIVFEMSAATKSISASQIARRLGISRKTAWYFMHKVRTAMKSSESQPIVNTVYVDEFVFGGQENLKQSRSTDSKKKKVVVAVEANTDRGVKRTYFKTIDNYSSQELSKIFVAHISQKATVITDKWDGYASLKANYNISQIKINVSDFFEINTIIHQLKAGLRSVYSWVSKKHFQKYLDEYSSRINRSIHKQTIFDNLISRMINNKNIDCK